MQSEKMTLNKAMKLTIDLIRNWKKDDKQLADKIEDKLALMATGEDVGDDDLPPFPNAIDCQLLKELIEASNDLYIGNCIL